jgi:hypothetical protein
MNSGSLGYVSAGILAVVIGIDSIRRTGAGTLNLAIARSGREVLAANGFLQCRWSKAVDSMAANYRMSFSIQGLESCKKATCASQHDDEHP